MFLPACLPLPRNAPNGLIVSSLFTEPFCLANYPSAFHSVMFNPVEPRLLATANSKEGVGLWDIRKPQRWVSFIHKVLKLFPPQLSSNVISQQGLWEPLWQLISVGHLLAWTRVSEARGALFPRTGSVRNPHSLLSRSKVSSGQIYEVVRASLQYCLLSSGPVFSDDWEICWGWRRWEGICHTHGHEPGLLKPRLEGFPRWALGKLWTSTFHGNYIVYSFKCIFLRREFVCFFSVSQKDQWLKQ